MFTILCDHCHHLIPGHFRQSLPAPPASSSETTVHPPLYVCGFLCGGHCMCTGTSPPPRPCSVVFSFFPNFVLAAPPHCHGCQCCRLSQALLRRVVSSALSVHPADDGAGCLCSSALLNAALHPRGLGGVCLCPPGQHLGLGCWAVW